MFFPYVPHISRFRAVIVIPLRMPLSVHLRYLTKCRIMGLVAAIACWRPGHLYEQVDELKNTVNSEGFRDIIDDAIMHLVKEECLRNRKKVSNGGT